MKQHFRAMGQVDRSEEENDDLLIYGIASTGKLDSKGTFIDQDSVWDAAKRAGTRPLFWEHDWGAPIGTVEEFARGDDMLLARSRVGKDFDVLVTKGLSATPWSVNNIRALVRQKITRGYSIGFDGDVIEDKNGGPPTIQVRELYEVSLCSIPSNPGTFFGFSRAFAVPDPRQPKLETITNSLSPVRFEFATPEDDDHELEVLKVALRSLQEAVADWK